MERPIMKRVAVIALAICLGMGWLNVARAAEPRVLFHEGFDDGNTDGVVGNEPRRAD